MRCFRHVIPAPPGWRVANVAAHNCHEATPDVVYEPVVAWAELEEESDGGGPGELSALVRHDDVMTLLPAGSTFYLCLCRPGEDVDPSLIEQWVAEHRSRSCRRCSPEKAADR